MKYMKPLSILLLFAVLFSMTACDTMDGLKEQSPAANNSTSSVEGPLAKAKPGTAAEDVTGNNLSFPVIWSDGFEKALRGEAGMEPILNDGVTFEADGYTWYLQGHPENEWQAGTYNPVDSGAGPVYVDKIDWGDNLEARSWPYGSQVRVETVLYKDLSAYTSGPMKTYEMKQQPGSDLGPDEVWGTRGIEYLSDTATVYSHSARLVIQPLTDREEPNLDQLEWNPVDAKWEGDFVSEPLDAGGAVWKDVPGPEGYSAEVNVQGKVIYGYNWVTKKTAPEPGDYRITFVLDENSILGPGDTFNTSFEGASILIREEGEEITVTEEPDLGGGEAKIYSDHVTYIDVRLTEERGGGNGGGGNGPGNGGGGGNGPGNGGGNGPGSGRGPNS